MFLALAVSNTHLLVDLYQIEQMNDTHGECTRTFSMLFRRGAGGRGSRGGGAIGRARPAVVLERGLRRGIGRAVKEGTAGSVKSLGSPKAVLGE